MLAKLIVTLLFLVCLMTQTNCAKVSHNGWGSCLFGYCLGRSMGGGWGRGWGWGRRRWGMGMPYGYGYKHNGVEE